MRILLDQGESVLHTNEHQRLLKEALIECVGNALGDRDLFSFLDEEALLVHFVKLFLFRKNLIVSEEPEEFALCDLLLLLSIELCLPCVSNQVLILL